MLSFKQVSQRDVARNRRIDHVEDLMFSMGRDGPSRSISILSKLSEAIGSGATDLGISVKWDGKPSLICGTNPENGRFFVATKSLFNADPLFFHTESEVRWNTEPGLADRLVECLLHLPKARIPGIVQGDLLFTRRDLLVTESEVAFRPNAIRYSVPATGSTGRDILRADIGIAFHTVYEGESMSSLKAVSCQFDPSSARGHPSVWMPAVSMRNLSEVVVPGPEREMVFEALQKCRSAVPRVGPFLDVLLSNADLSPHLSTYVNSVVTTGISEMSAGGLRLHATERVRREAVGLRTDSAKKRRSQTIDRIVNFCEAYARQLNAMFSLHKDMTSVKELLIGRLSGLTEFRHHFVDEGGIHPTDPEGFVVSDHETVVKLVSRPRFSAWNRKVNG